MAELILDLYTCDVGATADSPTAFADLLVSRVKQSWESGADVVCFPEFSWLGLESFVEKGTGALAAVANLFWNDLWPSISTSLNRSDKMAVLGSVPCVQVDGKLRNRAPILINGKTYHQDKLNLTPWEKAFSAGEVLHVFEFAGLKVAIIICLDVEVPELSVALRGQGVDLILVPSATESLLGVERVGRCSSARSVELGCFVAVTHLVGKTDSELVDENIGRLVLCSPSQSPFKEMVREDISPLFEAGFEQRRFALPLNQLARMRKRRAETNPSFLRPTSPLVQHANFSDRET